MEGETTGVQGAGRHPPRHKTPRAPRRAGSRASSSDSACSCARYHCCKPIRKQKPSQHMQTQERNSPGY